MYRLHGSRDGGSNRRDREKHGTRGNIHPRDPVPCVVRRLRTVVCTWNHHATHRFDFRRSVSNRPRYPNRLPFKPN